jgi:hypothetical protein
MTMLIMTLMVLIITRTRMTSPGEWLIKSKPRLSRSRATRISQAMSTIALSLKSM